jgi:tetratricopeptide (TPR) repeat protein
MTIRIRTLSYSRRLPRLTGLHLLLCLLLAGCFRTAGAAEPRTSFTLEGVLTPVRFARVSITGTNGYSANTPVYWDGKFKFKKLKQGSYVLTAYVPRVGEFRQTYNIGPSSVDEKGRMKVQILVHPSRATRVSTPRDRFTVSAKRLSITEKAWKEYFESHKKIRKQEFDEAVKHLEKAVAISPQFAVAWNQLGTLSYQKRDFKAAEQHFREAHKQDDALFEPVVNLGGVLLQTNQLEEAVAFNKQALEMRPRDALANAQMGLTYYEMKRWDEAIRYLNETKRLDPGHFTNPQLTLSDIYIKRGARAQAATELENFLRHHPDYAQAANIRSAIGKLRASR